MNKIYIISGKGTRFKVGISRRPSARIVEVDKTTPGNQSLMFYIAAPNARQSEALIHWLLSPFKSPERVGSGRTEWFDAWPICAMAAFANFAIMSTYMDLHFGVMLIISIFSFLVFSRFFKWLIAIIIILIAWRRLIFIAIAATFFYLLLNK